MCGIAGLIEAPGSVVDDAVLRRMGDVLAHRGPDEGRTWRGTGSLAHVGLSHRRLSILDHAGGKQPMTNGHVVVCFNGQIYNHLELRKRLVDQGAKFASDHSDTEVLLHAAHLWGSSTSWLEQLSGMFAFAVVDLDQRTILLARDPMGKKPLYIATGEFFDDGKPRIAFASELGALESLPHARRDVDERALARYLAFDFVPDPDCIYRGVFKLEPGCALSISLDDASTWRVDSLRARARVFRDLSFRRAAVAVNHDARVSQLRASIEDAVATRMIADVPVGIFLSGGVDSSLVAALAAQRSSKVETFSIGFREASFDESAHARAVAQHIGSVHHEQILDERALLDVLPKLGAHLSEPFADHSVVPTHLLSAFARQSVTVALGGDGGDELFLGYPTFLAELARPRLLDLLGGAASSVSSRLQARVSSLVDVAKRAAAMLPVDHSDFSLDFKIQRTLDGVAESRPLRRHQMFLTGAVDARLRALLSHDARARLDDRDVLADLDDLEVRAKLAGARDVFDVLQYGYAKTYLAAGVLQKVDRASMASSLEVRAPLLDNGVVDLALALPSSEKLRRFTTKAILKEVADAPRSRGSSTPLVPRAIVHRKKKGFGMPVASWLLGPLRPLVADLLSPRAIANDGLLDATVVARLVDEHVQKRANHRKILWALLMYRLWRTRPVST
jgi:asparagine synthase (glutamine-hydrolysing)